jgi:hypothetical protein
MAWLIGTMRLRTVRSYPRSSKKDMHRRKTTSDLDFLPSDWINWASHTSHPLLTSPHHTADINQPSKQCPSFTVMFKTHILLLCRWWITSSHIKPLRCNELRELMKPFIHPCDESIVRSSLDSFINTHEMVVVTKWGTYILTSNSARARSNLK